MVKITRSNPDSINHFLPHILNLQILGAMHGKHQKVTRFYNAVYIDKMELRHVTIFFHLIKHNYSACKHCILPVKGKNNRVIVAIHCPTAIKRVIKEVPIWISQLYILHVEDDHRDNNLNSIHANKEIFLSLSSSIGLLSTCIIIAQRQYRSDTRKVSLN